MNRIFGSKRDHLLVKAGVFLITGALIAAMVGCDGYNPAPSQNLEIRTWYDLDAIRDNLSGNHTLMNDLDSTTPGYGELASPTANEGKGWEPIGTFVPMRPYPNGSFAGTLDGQGYEIRDLYTDRADESWAGLFGCVVAGVIKDISLRNITVVGNWVTGGLVGDNMGTITNCSVVGSVSGGSSVGSLVGYNRGPITNCYAAGDVVAGEAVGDAGAVTGGFGVGGLIGFSERETVTDCWFTGNVISYLSCAPWGCLAGVGGLIGVGYTTVSHCYADANITGRAGVGGLVGRSGDVSDSYFIGSVIGGFPVGGLVGSNDGGIVTNSYYSYDDVLINGENMIAVGALSHKDFEQWMASGKFLDPDERLSRENRHYVVSNFTDFKELLAFGQNSSLKFRLTNDLDLGDEPDFYIPYFAGEFDGDSHRISNLTLNYDLAAPIGLFGYLATGGNVTGVGLEDINVNGYSNVGGLVGGTQDGTISHCYSSGTVTGNDAVGGLVGDTQGSTVSHCYSSGTVTGNDVVGGLMGTSNFAILTDSYSTATVTGSSFVGGLIGESGGTVSNSYSTGRVIGENDVGGLVGSNSGDVSDSYSTGRVTGDEHVGGLVGKNLFGGVSNSHSTGSVIGNEHVGGLVGYSLLGTVSSSYSTSSVSGRTCVGGLVGCSEGSESMVIDSYSTADVVGNEHVGGLVGWGLDGAYMSLSYSTGSVAGTKWVGGLVGNLGSSDYLIGCSVDACYSTGSVTGSKNVGGLVGEVKNQATVGGFWDIETSGQATSAGGTGKTTAQMRDIATFSGAGWNIITMDAPDDRNPSYIWNIVDGVTYPLLSWQV
jgi:hypothetical protein